MPVTTSFLVEEVAGFNTNFSTQSKSVTRRKFLLYVESSENGDVFVHPSAASQFFINWVRFNAASYRGVPMRSIDFREDPDTAQQCFEGEVEYGFDNNQQEDNQTDEDTEQEYAPPTFTFRGGKRKVMYPVRPVQRYGTQGTPLINYPMIGWDGEQFNGTEIDAPELGFSVPQWIPAENVNFALIRKFALLVGAVNSHPFYGLAPGEVMYLGPDHSWTTKNVESTSIDGEGNEISEMQTVRYAEFQHHFKCQPNLQNIVIGDMLIDGIIRGFDYVDIHYQDVPFDAGDGKTTYIAVPRQVDVVPVTQVADLWDIFN